MGRGMSLTESHVARATRAVERVPYPSRLTPLGEEESRALAGRILAGRPDGPLLIFAYGSLIWNPTFEPVGRHRAVARGWHRQFCMEIRGFRGTPDAPGLMMALVSGGRCVGVALEVAEDDAIPVVEALTWRELPNHENERDYRWITVDMAGGARRALVYWAGPAGPSIRRNIPPEEAARRIAAACGWRGSNAEYLRNTVMALAEHGIRDRNLWRLQHLVAAEIDRMFPEG